MENNGTGPQDLNSSSSSIYVPFDNGFLKAASVMGVASLVTTFFGLLTIPLVLGGLAIILSLLSS